MNAFRKPLMLVSACAMTLTAAACQTVPVPSSSVLEATVAEAVAIERETICEATKPVPMDPYTFDLLPTVVKKKIAQEAESWVVACG